MLDFAEHDSAPMPRLLEVGLYCKRFNCPPDHFGLDAHDPRILRGIALALNLFEAAVDRKSHSKKNEWDKAHPAQAKLLRIARRQESSQPDPYEVRVEIPTRYG